MGRKKKTRILGVTVTINGNSMYIDYRSKKSFEISIKTNENKINEIHNQIYLLKKSTNSKENDKALIGASTNKDDNNKTYNEKEIKSNQKEDLLNIDYFILLEEYSDNNFSNDLNDEFSDDPYSNFSEYENIYFNL